MFQQLESNCSKNGIQVYWAETVDQANKLVLEIAQRHNAKRRVKGKSMVSEEMELNPIFLNSMELKPLKLILENISFGFDHEFPPHHHACDS
ncbi:MAG: hypothetical protein CM1200mP30_17480 [Pseudomonadota bacterium]|nr:MAG: hypothetical protein CM1200mP30_17480 [Pseudomonadota bacterium]